MSKSVYIDKCFQCGEPLIQTKQYKEYINGSLVITTDSVCSDPECQKRTEAALERERQKRSFGLENKNTFGGPRSKGKQQ